MTQEELDRLVDSATEEQLRDIVRGWMESNGEFSFFCGTFA